MKRVKLNYTYGNFNKTKSVSENWIPKYDDLLISGFVDDYEMSIEHSKSNKSICDLEIKSPFFHANKPIKLISEEELYKDIFYLLCREGELKNDTEFNKSINLIRFRLTEPNKVYLICGSLRVVTRESSEDLYLEKDYVDRTKLIDSDFESWEDVDSVVNSLNEISKRLENPVKSVKPIRTFTERNIIIPEKYREAVTYPHFSEESITKMQFKEVAKDNGNK